MHHAPSFSLIHGLSIAEEPVYEAPVGTGALSD